MADRVRRKRYLALLAAFVMLVMAVPANLLAQDGAKVVDIAISGNANINTDAIMNAVSLKTGDVYTEAAIEKDKAAIMALGYFSVVTVHKQDVENGVKVTYEVTENPRIADVKVTGSEPVPAATVLGLMRTQGGQVLNVPALNQDIAKIQEYYYNEGYVAYVEEVQIDPQTGVLNVPVVVHRVESIEITGNKKTLSYVFLREMKTKPGDVFNRFTYATDLKRIWSLGILEDINERYEINPGSEIGLIKIVQSVVEKKTGQISLGFGYSSRQRLVGQAKLQETNFMGKGQGLNLLWEQGTSSSAVGGNASYELSFFEPWVDKHHTSLNVSLYNKLLYRFSSGVFGSGSTFADDEFYSERHKGGDITVSRPLNDNLRVYLGGKYENVDANPALLKDANGISNLVNIVQTGNVGSGSIRLVHNTRDEDINPAAGGYNAISFELGTVDVTEYSDKDAQGNPVNVPIAMPFKGGYQKTAIDVRRYFSKLGYNKPVGTSTPTWALRLRAGVASGKMPYFEQFFVGGSESLRGYKEDRFWGTRMMVASVEYRRPISQGLIGVLFADYGDAWGTASTFSIPELPQHNSFEGNLGVGVGMRVETPIGNIRLDYGVGSEGARTHFSMGQAF